MRAYRRPFADVVKLTKEPGLAHEALRFYQLLYRIENQVTENNLDAQARYSLRLQEATPILDEFKLWLLKHQHQVPHASQLGQGIQYCLNHWTKLTNYLRDGRLRIDNNAIENLIRPFASGRRNWLFMGSPSGAKAAATFYSLIATARAIPIPPEEAN